MTTIRNVIKPEPCYSRTVRPSVWCLRASVRPIQSFYSVCRRIVHPTNYSVQQLATDRQKTDRQSAVMMKLQLIVAVVLSAAVDNSVQDGYDKRPQFFPIYPQKMNVQYQAGFKHT